MLQTVFPKKVSVLEMADAREKRVKKQEQLLIKYKQPVLSFSLNIPGPYKISDCYLWAFEYGKELIVAALSEANLCVLSEKSIYESTGYECYFCIEGDPLYIKRKLTMLEEASPVGRIFDIDIIAPNGQKISREEIGLPMRKCILCDNDAYVCARNRTHTVDELVTRINKMIDEIRLEK